MLTASCVDVLTVPEMVSVLTTPGMNVLTVPCVDVLIVPEIAIALTVPGINVLTVSDLVSVLTVPDN